MAWTALLAASALAIVWLVRLAFVFRASPGWGYDFEAYLLAAHRLVRGASLYLPWTVSGPFQPGPYGLYLYSPPLAVGILPFTAISLPAATAVWFAIRAIMLVVAAALMPVRGWIRLLVLVLAVVSLPVLTDLNLGNVSLIVMFLSVVAWRYLDRPPAAVAVALVMTVRPTFGLFLVTWLLRRRWRQALVCLVAGTLLIAVTLPFVGASAYLDYVQLLRNLADLTRVPNNLDLGSTAIALGLGDTAATLALVAGYALAIGAVLFSLRRDREVSFMVTLGATLLVSPLLQDHFLVGALIPIAFLLERGGRAWLVAVMVVLLYVPGPGAAAAVVAMLAPLMAPTKDDEGYSPEPLPGGVGTEAGSETGTGASKRTMSPA